MGTLVTVRQLKVGDRFISIRDLKGQPIDLVQVFISSYSTASFEIRSLDLQNPTVFTVSYEPLYNPSGKIIRSAYFALEWRRVSSATSSTSSWARYEAVIPDDYQVELLSSDSQGKLASTKQYLVKLDFNYSLNKNCWTSHLEKQMIQKAVTEAESKIRRSLREWPFGKKLAYNLDKDQDSISFYWEDNRAVK